MRTLDAEDAYAAALSETARLLREDALLHEAIADLTGDDAEHTGTATRPPRAATASPRPRAGTGAMPPHTGTGAWPPQSGTGSWPPQAEP